MLKKILFIVSLFLPVVSAPVGAVTLNGVPPAVRNYLETLQADANFNLRYGSDGSITVETEDGTVRYLPMVPSGLSQPSSIGGDLSLNPDGSIGFGSGGATQLFYVPLVDSPGVLPGLPEGFLPPDGVSFPDNVGLPPGFVPPVGMSVPPSMIPPLPPGTLLTEMGLTQGVDFYIAADGTVIFGDQRYVPFVDGAGSVGVPRAGASRGFVINPDGTVSFPDGTLFAPIVTDADNLPRFQEGFVPPSNTTLPANIALPEGFLFPADVALPAGLQLPMQSRFEPGVVLPPNTLAPPGTFVPDGVIVPDDFVVSPGIVLPPGTSFQELPAGAQILADGSLMIPGFVVPPGVEVPAGFTLPGGARTTADGRIVLPPPPRNGFPIDFRVIHNADGSVTLPPPPDGVPLPPAAVVNQDGTVTLPPPPFWGSIGAQGAFRAQIDQFDSANLPLGAVVATDGTVQFTQHEHNGFPLGDSQVDLVRQSDGSWNITGTGLFSTTDPAFAGAMDPRFTLGPNGEMIMAPPEGFMPMLNADGSFTVPAAEFPEGAPLPPGAVRNADGSVTILAAPQYMDPLTGSHSEYMGAILNDDGTMTMADGSIVIAPPIVGDGFLIDPVTGMPVGPDGVPILFNEQGLPIDPVTGEAFIPGQMGMPMEGVQFDPETGYPIDPVTGQIMDPTTGQIYGTGSGFLPPPPGDLWVPPCDPATDPTCGYVPPGGMCDPATDPTCGYVPPDGMCDLVTDPTCGYVPPDGMCDPATDPTCGYVPPGGMCDPATDPTCGYVPPGGMCDPAIDPGCGSGLPDGTMPPPDGTMPPPDGTMPPPDGTMPPPDGTMPPPDGTMPPPDGTMPPPI